MNQLMHWNPFRSLSRAESASGLDALFRDFGIRTPFAGWEPPDIRIDVSENGKAFTVKADIPGVGKDDIDVAVDGRQVTITARSSRKSERKDETAIYTERSEGQVFRSFTLPSDVDEKGASAKYEDGVLTLTLPKRKDANNHRVKVS